MNPVALEGGSKNSKNFSGRGDVGGVPRPEVFFSLALKESLRPSREGRVGEIAEAGEGALNCAAIANKVRDFKSLL